MDTEVRIPECVARIRPLAESDLHELEWEGGADFRRYYLQEWAEHYAGTRPVLVADFRGFPIGQIVINFAVKPPVLESLRVMPPFRGLGIGTALIEAAERRCRDAGYTTVRIGVSVDNVRARRLYERLGYKAEGLPYPAEWSYTDQHGTVHQVRERIQMLRRALVPQYAGSVQ